ncbi:UNVERIFIED_CONTAM: hypothetical protein BEN50_23845 [Euhalothece sp. KZN 001]
MHRLVAALVGGVLLVTLIGGVLVGGPSVDSAQTATVTVVDAASTAPLVTYEVAVSYTYAARVQGLSGTEALPAGSGMLFVHPREATHAYVMREMAYPIDIIFIDSAGTITAIHTAAPEDVPESQLTRYRGTGRYVLEVPAGSAARHDVTVGDRVRLPTAVSTL